MLLKYITSLILFFIISCQDKLPVDTAVFKDVLIKIHECESYNELKFQNSNAAFEATCKNQVLSEMNVKTSDYDKMMTYYKSNPKELELIYDSILTKYN